jgi:dolichol-phosphate hexosyltransferase
MEDVQKSEELTITENYWTREAKECKDLSKLDSCLYLTQYPIQSWKNKQSVFSMSKLAPDEKNSDYQLTDFPSIQVMIAALNEENGITATITELSKYLNPSKIIVVDGKSVDKTVEAAKKLGAKTIIQDGKGKGDAFTKAIKYVASQTDYVIITDADHTYPAEYLPEMVRLLEENPKVGMICGNRFNKNINSQNQGDLFFFGNRVLAFIHNILNGIHLTDPLTGLRVVRAELIRNWEIQSKGFDIEVELNHHVEREGFGIVEVPIKYRERIGEKKLKVRHGLNILRRILIETTY